MHVAILLLSFVLLQDTHAPATSREAIGKLQFLVGEWKVIVEGEGKTTQETLKWEFLFNKNNKKNEKNEKDEDEWALQCTVKDGRRAKSSILRYDSKKKIYRLEEILLDGSRVVYEGKPGKRELVFEQKLARESAADRMNWILLRSNRFIGSIDHRRAGSKAWLESHQLQFTKKGVPFVRNKQPKCVVTGGEGTIEVTHGGKTYLVCCNSCRKEFTRDPVASLADAKKEGWIK